MNTETGAGQYLTFTLDGDQYAADVTRVREVLEVLPFTKLPGMPSYMRGVINIRGSVVPVVDLREKFGMPQVEQTVDTSIIVMDVEIGDKSMTVGCLADSVEEVVDIVPESVEEAPTLGTAVDAAFISGIARKDDAFIILLDINRVFGTSDLLNLNTEAAVTATDG